MRRVGIGLVLSLLLPLAATNADAQDSRIQAIRIHGNHSVPDEELLRAAGIEPGAPLTAETVGKIEDRLRNTGRFESVEVRVRYRGLDDAGDAVLILVVREKTALAKKWMVGPLLGLSDEYGFTYGAQLAFVDLPFNTARLQFPVSWGGERSAAAKLVLPLKQTRDGWNHRLELGVGRHRTIHPHFDVADSRNRFDAALTSGWKALNLGASARRSAVSFDTLEDSFSEIGFRASIDTRLDRTIPGNAFYLALDWDRLFFTGSESVFEGVNRVTTDVRGYKRLFGQATLAAQVRYERADGPLPNYAKSFLGGGRTLRGHEAGRFIGDRIALGSLELRLPLSSTLTFQRAGIHLFYDTGSAFDASLSLRKAQFEHGVGFGGFLRVAFVGVRLDVGFDLEGNTRFHFGSQFKF